jgi:asparagine synthase (glutamine-hydrolysing)
MCGIAGILGETRPGDQGLVEAMAAMLSHRGPDATRTVSQPGATLGHTRLSIIDLSDQGLQPMTSHDNRYILVYNGEIYNYKELRACLGGSAAFNGTSDTEVLLAAWQQWGEGCLEQLNGMFAFCIYDTHERTAFLARDRFGQKPIYLAELDGRLVYASEIKALMAAGVEARPDLATWSRYLVSASYDDNAATYFAGISQLLPGECATWTPGKGLSRRRYYDIAEHAIERQVNADEAAAETRDLLLDVARLHMRADVPVAIALSGGLDSSALLACLDAAGELNEDVKCFSVDFGAALSESHWIEAAADHHHVQSHISGFDQNDFRASMTPMMWHLEGPIGGLMNCALDHVAGPANAAGYKVILDGTGLDEAFGGYRNHHNLYLGGLLQSSTPSAEGAVKDYARNWSVSEAEARAAGLAELDRAHLSAIDGTIPVRLDLLAPSVLGQAEATIEKGERRLDPVREALLDYLQVRKIPRNTRMKDRQTMAYGLELRLPFLDHRLVEHALSLPLAHLFQYGRSKSIVREALTGLMDEEVRTATKRSIQAPQGKWMIEEPMRTYIEDLINSESFAGRGLFDVPAAKSAFKEFCRGDTPNSFFVWQWLNVEEWYRTFIDNDPLTNRHPLSASTTH